MDCGYYIAGMDGILWWYPPPTPANPNPKPVPVPWPDDDDEGDECTKTE